MEGCTLSSQKSDFDIFRVNLITDATAIPLGWLRYASDDAWAEDARDLLTELAVYLPEQPISSCSVIVSILASQHNGVWYKDVEVEWAYIDRAKPIGPYASLIADYGQLEQIERAYAQQYMDELFTAAEYHTLRHHLENRRGLAVHMSIVPIPMQVQPESVGFIATPAQRMAEVDESGNFGWYTLNDLQGALPFKVAAWYYVGNSTAEDANP